MRRAKLVALTVSYFPRSRRRMKVRQHHEAPKVLQPSPVQLQGQDGGTPYGASPFDSGPVGGPTKVLIPNLPARMKQGNGSSSGWIKGGRLGGLMAVAALTGKCQIFEGDVASFAARHYVFGREGGRRDSRRRQAVFAAKPGALCYKAACARVRALRHNRHRSGPTPTSIWGRTFCAQPPVR